MADLSWHDNGNYHWCQWDTSDSNQYDYYVRVAANSYRDGGTYFNLFNSLPNVNAPDGATKMAVLNGSYGYYNGSQYVTYGPEVLYNCNITQEKFGGEDYSVQACMGANGGNITIGTINDIWGSGEDFSYAYSVVLNAPSILSSGQPYGSGNYSTRHSFVGRSGSTSFMGYATTGYGSTIHDWLISYFGSGTKVAILDGGGSTQMWYNGSTKVSSSDSGGVRNIKNAIVLYRKLKSAPATKYTISTDSSPYIGGTTTGSGQYYARESVTISATANSGYTFTGWGDIESGNLDNPRQIIVTGDRKYYANFAMSANEDNEQTSTATGVPYVYKDGSLVKVKSFKSKLNDVLVENPSSIKVKLSGVLTEVLKKFTVTYKYIGGTGSPDSETYYCATGVDTLPTPTHGSYQSKAVAFDGWYKDPNMLVNKISKIGKSATGDRTLYAKWVQTMLIYLGTYTTTTTAWCNMSSDSYSGSGTVWWDKNNGTHASTTKVTKVWCDVDYCTSSWTSYYKPRVTYGYYISAGSGGYTELGECQSKGGDAGSVDCNFDLPAGAWVGFKSYPIGDGVAREKAFFNGGGYSYNIATTKSVDASDNWESSSPPSGSWVSTPTTMTKTRFKTQDGNWTAWGN